MGVVSMSESLLPKRFLFRFATPCRYKEPLWTKEGAGLGRAAPPGDFAELEGQAAPIEVRAGWSEAGLAFACRVEGKQQPAWCRRSTAEDSDGLHVWIDTRDVHNVHRAGRFCHRFLFLPPAAGRGSTGPWPNGCRFNAPAATLPQPAAAEQLQVRSEIGKDGYLLEAFMPAAALTGFDPQEHPRLGFTYAVLDRELGVQTFGVGSPCRTRKTPASGRRWN